MKGLSSLTEEGHHWGLVLYAISYSVLAYLFGVRPYIVAAGIFPMAYGDSLAAIFGECWGRHKYRVFETKSLEGSLGMFLGSFVSLTLAFLYFGLYLPLHLQPARPRLRHRVPRHRRRGRLPEGTRQHRRPTRGRRHVPAHDGRHLMGMLVVIDGLDASGRARRRRCSPSTSGGIGKTCIIRSHPSDDNFFGVKGREYLFIEGKEGAHRREPLLPRRRHQEHNPLPLEEGRLRHLRPLPHGHRLPPRPRSTGSPTASSPR